MIVRSFAIVNALTCKPDGSAATGISIEQASITFDRSWAPYCQTQLTLQTPGLVNIPGIEPRNGLRCRFTLMEDDLAGNTVATAFDLGLRSRSLDWLAGTASVGAASDEALWQDWADVQLIPGVPDTGTAVGYAAERMGWKQNTNFLQLTSAPIVTLVNGNPVTADSDEGFWPAGQSGWDYTSQQASLAGAWLFCDEQGIFRYAPSTWSADTTQRTFGPLVKNVVDSVSRDDGSWANSAVVTYTPPSGGASSSVTSIGASPRKVVSSAIPRKKPTNGNAAASIATAAKRRGRTLVIESVLDTRIRPNQPGVANYQGQSYAGTVRAVTFRLPEGTMSVTLDVTES